LEVDVTALHVDVARCSPPRDLPSINRVRIAHASSHYAIIARNRPRSGFPPAVGRHNLFGRPTASTLANLRDTGMTVYRTDRCRGDHGRGAESDLRGRNDRVSRNARRIALKRTAAKLQWAGCARPSRALFMDRTGAD
jgi:hypothetical protein